MENIALFKEGDVAIHKNQEIVTKVGLIVQTKSGRFIYWAKNDLNPTIFCVEKNLQLLSAPLKNG